MSTILKIKSLLNDSFSLEGDFLDLRVYNGDNFMHLLAAAKGQGKTAYGIDTWCGLEKPTEKDLTTDQYYMYNKGQLDVSKQAVMNRLNRDMPTFPNYVLLDSIEQLPEYKKFSFVLLDKILYYPTKDALAKIWDKISYGGTIFVPSYQYGFAADLAVREFLKEREKEIIVNRQLIINEMKEKFLIIKCFNPINKPASLTIAKPSAKQITVAMVLKTGGSYNYQYVNALASAIKRNTTRDVEIACLTDNSTGFNADVDTVISFNHNWPKWWGKIELFRPDLFQGKRVFFIDLDTVIVDNIDEILDFEFDFCGLRDFYKMVSLGSGLMSWNSHLVHKIYNEFVPNADRVISTYSEGDQQWIDQHKPRTVFFQDIFPKEVISFKKDCLQPDETVIIPKGAKIICFHGVPKPHTILDPSISDHWKP